MWCCLILYSDASKAASHGLHSDAVHIASMGVHVGSGGSVPRQMGSRANCLMNRRLVCLCLPECVRVCVCVCVCMLEHLHVPSSSSNINI